MKALAISFTTVLCLVASAAANTFTVNNTVDPGNGTCDALGCTLREAIDSANANPGADIIAFDIPGAGVQTISPASPLPDLSEAITIDGYTQPGASANTLEVGNDAVLLIELDGTLAGAANGLNLDSNDVVRGLVINRFSSVGISIGTILGIDGSNNVIEGNFIGTDAAGTADLGNNLAGVGIFIGTGNLIGGVLPAARNLISGNDGSGVWVYGVVGFTSDNSIQGNYIGTDRNGVAALPNDGDGVFIFAFTSDNKIGGTEVGAGNLISGNIDDGVLISSGQMDNTIQGNFIGTDATGTADLANGGNGIDIGASSNMIGGTTASARNIIVAGDLDSAVLIAGGATDNLVQGNFIGVDVTGSIALGEADNGVLISDSPANTIGGTTPGAGNVIAGRDFGLQIISAGATGNLVQGNFIGTDATGTAPLGNITGILLSVNAAGTIIGGPAGAGNIIAFSAGHGIAVNSTSTGNSIFGNSIFANGGLGIDLGGGVEDGNDVTANDFPDGDAGANNLQNYPVIDEIAVDGEDRSVEGSLASNPNTDYVLNFYSNSEVDPSGYGEGETWLGSLDVHTNVQSTTDFSFPLESGSRGRFITATATDPAGNTSEFSLASELVPPLSRFLNISTRLRVQTGDNVLIGGFIITGNDAKQVIVRAIGPSLGDFGVADPLADPILELHYSDGTTVLTNNNWRTDQESEITATGLAPSDDLESAIVATLDPGAYTAIVRGVNSGTGVALVETYDLSSVGDSALANISTRGLVETGDNVMIGGIIVGPEQAPTGSVLLRGIGPSLGAFGVPDPLADPMLELRDGNGALVMANDNWKSTQQAAIEDTGLAPGNDMESAILASLAAGPYTAILSGVGGTTGIGLVEAYHLD